MVNEAEENAEADAKQVKIIQARNNAESALNSLRRDVNQYGDKVTAEEKEKATTAITALEEVLGQDDVEQIETKSKELYEACSPILKVKYDEEEKAKNAKETSSEKSDNNMMEAEVKEASV
jgi:molecular chaperone DnaK